MLRRTAFFVSLAALLASGCSSTTPTVTTERGPHQGILLPLSGHPGFAEVIAEAVAVPAPAPKPFRPTAFVIYFLAPDKTSSMAPAPGSVSVDVIWPDSTPRQTLVLKPEPKPGDPAGAARFTSAPGDYDAALSGTITAKFGDRTVKRAF